MANRATVKILDATYHIVSEEAEEYTQQVARKVDERLRALMEADSRISTASASVLAAMEFCDECSKATEAADNLRSQIKGYIEEINRVKTELSEQKREVFRLSGEVHALQVRLDQKR